jgi:fructose-1,6-bisphosphatase/inositol monophosphatase family enzyme
VGDCVQYALLCRGALDAAIDPLMKPWDIGAIAPCVLEAGGSISDLNGETAQIVERSSFIAASSANLRLAICACVGRPRSKSSPIGGRRRLAPESRLPR